ncbi:MAG: DUF6250 domain-containing protein [Bacteroidales bacterium]
MKKSLIYIFILSSLHVFSQKENAGKLIYSDNFNADLSNWKTEFETPETSSIKLIESKLDLVSSKGATIWFKTKLSGNVMITYDETLIDKGGSNDRVSDMNVFWMATDPLNPKTMIERDGKFSSYDNLNLYYAGVGGHYNKFTRFRKYNCNGEKPVLKEYSDVAHLLVGNKKYSIKIIVNNSLIQYYLNNELYWELKDEAPYKEGYFGFRTTISHQQFENFKVFRLN